jgi:hypothetical protein
MLYELEHILKVLEMIAFIAIEGFQQPWGVEWYTKLVGAKQ